MAAIMAILGPLLLAAFEKWLTKRLEAKEKTLVASGDAEADAATLLRAVRDDLWPWQWRKKNFLSQAIRDVPPVVGGRAVMTGEQKKTLSNLGRDAN